MDSGYGDPDEYEPDDYWYPSPLPSSWGTASEPWQPLVSPRSSEPPTRIDPSGPAAPVVGPTAALRGRAGGPGFSVSDSPRPPAGERARSGWQAAQGVWDGSGIRWADSPSAPPSPIGSPVPAAVPAPPGHAEQALAAGPRPKEFPGVHAFFSAPVMADAEAPPAEPAPSPYPCVPGTPLATGEADERYAAWRDSVREASSPGGSLPEPPAPSSVPDPRPVRGGAASALGRTVIPAAVLISVGAGAYLMLTGQANQMMNAIPGNHAGQAQHAPARPAPHRAP